ncbi:MAG: sulfite exporter TauE/SafE family protein [Cyanosarcina radialis HA8281-LM2]|jgi:nickel/cobalt exporter|nr:sulfite exporter TauE/SafE family protein [Cyanosarcina radialis HA8281-LM2]
MNYFVRLLTGVHRQGWFGLGVLVTIWLLTGESALAHPENDSAVLDLLNHENLTPSLTLAGLGIAFLLGAGHALSPGHGKTMVAAYLVGSRGTALDAVLLGFVTTIAHMLTVFLLGLVALFASQYVLPEQLSHFLGPIAGLTVCVVGCWLLVKYLKHPSDSDCHHHHHEGQPGGLSHKIELHSHDSHTHTHTQSERKLGSLIAMGVAGGIIPCPSALVLLLTAIGLNQTAYGMFLIGSFSLGLSAVLVGIGLAVLYARQWLNYLPESGRMRRYLPVMSAIAVIITGAILTAYSVYSV